MTSDYILNRRSIEYYLLQIVTDPATTTTDWSASFDGGTTWTTAADIESVGQRWSGWLVAGPDASTPGTATVLPTGPTWPLVRHVDNPETIIRKSPLIYVGG